MIDIDKAIQTIKDGIKDSGVAPNDPSLIGIDAALDLLGQFLKDVHAMAGARAAP